MKSLFFLMAIGFIVLFNGCAKQQPKLGTSVFPEVNIKAEKEVISEQIARKVLEKNFNIVSETSHSIDYRAPIGSEANPIALAIMQSLDGSTIEEKGIDFNLMQMNNYVKVQAKPYLYKTYKYRNHNPTKQYVENNSDAYNTMIRLLNEVKEKAESVKLEDINKTEKDVKSDVSSLDKLIELSKMYEKGLITKDEFDSHKKSLK